MTNDNKSHAFPSLPFFIFSSNFSFSSSVISISMTSQSWCLNMIDRSFRKCLRTVKANPKHSARLRLNHHVPRARITMAYVKSICSMMPGKSGTIPCSHRPLSLKRVYAALSHLKGSVSRSVGCWLHSAGVWYYFQGHQTILLQFMFFDSVLLPFLKPAIDNAITLLHLAILLQWSPPSLPIGDYGLSTTNTTNTSYNPRKSVPGMNGKTSTLIQSWTNIETSCCSSEFFTTPCPLLHGRSAMKSCSKPVQVLLGRTNSTSFPRVLPGSGRTRPVGKLCRHLVRWRNSRQDHRQVRSRHYVFWAWSPRNFQAAPFPVNSNHLGSGRWSCSTVTSSSGQSFWRFWPKWITIW